MNPILLDAGGAFLFEFVVLIFLGLATLVEAIVLLLMKFNPAGKSFMHALIVNLVSLAMGFLLLRLLRDTRTVFSGSGRWIEISVMFLITFIIEGLLLLLLNRKKPAKNTWAAALVMNLVSYLILLLFIFL